MPTYKDFCFGKKIHRVELERLNIIDINAITIYLDDNYIDVMTIYAEADCCSSSWFYFFEDSDIKKIIGKEIKSINIVGPIDLPPSDIQERDLNDIVQILFTDSTTYNFVLRNSSNGYYTGYLNITTESLVIPEERNKK